MREARDNKGVAGAHCFWRLALNVKRKGALMRARGLKFWFCWLAVAAALGANAGEEDAFQVRGLGGAGGMFVPSISPYEPKLMLVACDMSGSYRSLDGGQTWALIHCMQMNGNAGSAFPAYLPDKIFWHRGALLRVSADKGVTWRDTAAAFPWDKQEIRYLAAFPGTPALVFASAGEGLWRSEDEGQTWVRVIPEASREIISLGKKLFTISGKNTVQASEDQGKTWAAKPAELFGKNTVFSLTGGTDGIASVLFASAWNVGVVRSQDEGRTWQVVINKFDDQKLLEMASNQTKSVYAAQHGGGWCKTVWNSADGGATWQSCFRMTGADRNVSPSWVQTELGWGYYISPNGFFASRSDPNVAILTTQGDLYITRDGGKTWQQHMNEILGVQPGDTAIRYKCTGLEVTSCWGYLFDPWEKNRQYIAYTDIGFGRTVDNGQTWSWSAKGSPWVNTFYDVIFDPDVKGRMYAACSNRHDIPHWTHVSPNDPKSPHHVGGVCLSEDQAVNWRPLGKGLPAKPCTSICLDPASSKDSRTLYTAIYEAGVFKSTDGGQTWSAKSNGLGNAGNLHVYRIRRHPKTGHLFCLITGCREGQLDFKVPGGIWKSTDGAENWTAISAAPALVWPTNFTFEAENENTIYMAAATAPGKAQGGVYKTSDGGQTWTQVIKDADFAQTGGSSYEHVMSVALYPDDKNLVYAGTNAHGLWYSRDAGATWKRYTAFPFQNVQSINFAPDDHTKLYLTTFGGGVWVGAHLPKE